MERRSEQRQVSSPHEEIILDYNRLVVKEEEFNYGGNTGFHPVYYLRIEKKRGQVRAEDCSGFITLDKNEINNYTIWDGNVVYIPITHQAILKLFKVNENQYDHKKTIVFDYGPDEKKLFQYRVPYNDSEIWLRYRR